MRKGEFRDKISNAVDEIEGCVASVLSELEEVEEKAAWDAEALSKDDIEELQTAVIDAIKDLKELEDALY